MPSDPDLKLAADFPAATRDAWLKLVEKVLKGADFEKRLVSRSADGIAVQPLYTRADALPAADRAVPGVAPFTRGGGAAGAGWDIRQRVTETAADQANAAILADLEGGVTSLVLDIAAPGRIGLPVDAIARALDGVLLDICAVALDAGERFGEAAAALDRVWTDRGIPTGECRGCYGADPIGTLARNGSLARPVADLLAEAARLAARSDTPPGVTVFRADGRPYHGAGASEAQELAAILATVVADLKAMEAAGLPPAEALGRIAVTVAVDTQQFWTIAKLRALRRCLWRIGEATGAADAAGRIPITAETAERMLARRDPWVNMLRATLATAAAAMGGADAVTVLPFTTALGQPDAFARRVARNTQLVLMEESALGRVVDPAGGSWAIEKLTDDLARAAWALFQEIEAAGGIVAALASGDLQRRIATVAEARAKEIATGRSELTGVSAFPNPGDDGVRAEPWPTPAPVAHGGSSVGPLPLRRLAAPFEALRDRADCAAAGGTPLKIFLANLGTLAEFNVRATWIRNYLAAGGIAAIDTAGFTASGDAGRAFAESGATIALICSTDATYALLGEATAQALKSAGAREVWLAGRPKDQEAALRNAGVDGFVYAGGDAIATLEALHEKLGSPA